MTAVKRTANQLQLDTKESSKWAKITQEGNEYQIEVGIPLKLIRLNLAIIGTFALSCTFFAASLLLHLLTDLSLLFSLSGVVAAVHVPVGLTVENKLRKLSDATDTYRILADDLSKNTIEIVEYINKVTALTPHQRKKAGYTPDAFREALEQYAQKQEKQKKVLQEAYIDGHLSIEELSNPQHQAWLKDVTWRKQQRDSAADEVEYYYSLHSWKKVRSYRQKDPTRVYHTLLRKTYI